VSYTQAHAAWSCAPLNDSVPWLRHRIRAEIKAAGIVEPDGEVAYAIELVASELLSNAVRHKPSTSVQSGATRGETITVALHWQPTAARVVATDPYAGMPQHRNANVDDESGRGLLLMAAIGTWGVRPSTVGKHVWCEIPYGSGGLRDHA
jgi:anti-sigma regulatory factor (Ser/Thr protein kinase)